MISMKHVVFTYAWLLEKQVQTVLLSLTWMCRLNQKLFFDRAGFLPHKDSDMLVFSSQIL